MYHHVQKERKGHINGRTILNIVQVPNEEEDALMGLGWRSCFVDRIGFLTLINL